MRSRYSAYVAKDANWLLQSWHPATRPASISFDPAQRFLGLTIKRVVAGTRTDSEGIVTFVARYKIDGKGFRLAETSQFGRLDGTWVYIDGELTS